MKYILKRKNRPDKYFDTKLEFGQYIYSALVQGDYELIEKPETATDGMYIRRNNFIDEPEPQKVKPESLTNHSQTLASDLNTDMITATDYGTPGGDKTVTVTAEKNGDEIRVLDLKIDEPDMVNHPPHYANKDPETIQMIRAVLTKEEFTGYCKGQILKYRDRAHDKGNLEQDMAKAKFYYDLLMEVENERDKI